MSAIKIGIIGLGYVGLPLARLFAMKYNVIGFDVNDKRVSNLKKGEDYTQEVDSSLLKQVLLNNYNEDNGLYVTSDPNYLKDCNYYIVTVPTSVDKNNQPVLIPLLKASKTIATYLKKDDIVIYESTVYPGATEEDCIPVLEKVSKLVFNQDFFVGYSPERISPGDKIRTVENILKVTSGSTKDTAQKVDDLYRSVIKSGTHLASSIKVAEASKIIENCQRDINIAFVNELAKIFSLYVSQKTRTDDQFQPKNTRRNTTGKVQVILQGKKDELLAVAEECFPYMPKGETDPMLSLAVVPVATLLEVRDRCQYTCDGLLVLRDTDDDDAPSFRLAPECSCPFTAGPSVYGKTVLSEAGDVFFNRKPFIGNSANRLAPFFEVDCYGFTPFNLNDNNLGRYQAEFCLGEPTVQTLMGWDLVTEYADPSHHILMVVESPIMKTDYHFYTPNLNFVAGSVEPTKDRNLVDAALREVVEETGIVLSPEECVPLGVPITKTLWRNVPSGDAQSKKCQVFLIHDLGSNRSRQSRSLLIHDADRCLRRQDGRIQSIQSMRRLMSAAFFVPREYGVDVYDAACMALRSQLSYWRGKRPRTSRLLRSHSLREGDLQCVLLIEVVQQMQQVQGSEFHYLHAKYFPCEYAPTLAELRTKLSLPRLSVDDVTRAWYGYDWGDCHYKLKVDVMEQERRRGGGVNTGGKYTKQQHHSNTNRSRTTAKEPPGNGRWGRGQKPSQHRHNRGGGGGGGGGRGGGGGGGSGGGYKGGGGGYRGGGGGYSGGGGGAGGGYR